MKKIFIVLTISLLLMICGCDAEKTAAARLIRDYDNENKQENTTTQEKPEEKKSSGMKITVYADKKYESSAKVVISYEAGEKKAVVLVTEYVVEKNKDDVISFTWQDTTIEEAPVTLNISLVTRFADGTENILHSESFIGNVSDFADFKVDLTDEKIVPVGEGFNIEVPLTNLKLSVTRDGNLCQCTIHGEYEGEITYSWYLDTNLLSDQTTSTCTLPPDMSNGYHYVTCVVVIRTDTSVLMNSASLNIRK